MPYSNAQDQKAYARKHYEANKEAYKARAVVSKEKQKAENREYIRQYLLINPCVDCGNADIRVLQFDHIDPSTKHKCIGQLVDSKKKMLEEIAKCEVRCANCHMIRTAEQFGWTRVIEEK